MSQNSILGPEVTVNGDDGTVVHNASFGGGGGSRFSGGGSTTPPASLVTTTGSNLEFNLIWDSSVASAPTGFMTDVISVAKYYESIFTAKQLEVINIHVGWGEIAGSSLSSGALGESESNGYLTNYSTVTNALMADGFTFNASNEPTGAQFFITSAEAKNYGLISGTSSGVDGYIGFGTLSGTSYSWDFNLGTGGAGTGSTGYHQFDFQGVVQHEISEVLGRIEMEGHTTIYGRATYTPLDLFNYDSYNSVTGQGHLVLSSGDNTGSQVSSIFAMTDHNVNYTGGTFNDGYQGGDIADWASWNSTSQSGTGASGQDAYDAFAWSSVNTDLSKADYNVDLTLGLLGTGALIS